MAAAPLRTQSLFLSSARSSLPRDTPADWGVALEPGLLECGPDEYMTLTLESFYCVHDWTWMPEGATVTIAGPAGDAVAALPTGNPTLVAVAAAITAAAAPSVPGFRCAFNPATNKLELTADADFVVIFPTAEDAARLGFTSVLVDEDGASVVVEPGVDAIASDRPVLPIPISTVRIDLAGVRAVAHNLSNLTATALAAPCHTLAAIPVHGSRPFTLFEWHNPGGAFPVVLADDKVQELRFRLTDWEGRPLAAMGPHHLVLRVDTRSRGGSPTERAVQALAADVRAMLVLELQHAAARGA